MTTQYPKLTKFFPMIRTRDKILDEIESTPSLLDTYNSWSEEHREEFLDICSGNKGVKMLYDSYFKEILNPETTPDRLSRLLSILIGKKVTVKHQLSNDNSRLGDESALIITDIVVELEDGTIANVEVQKIGYMFTGERASCYSADLLLRQYKRVKDSSKEKFSYKDIAPVYTIIFMEDSPPAFQKFKDQYIHKFTTVSDTGLSLNILQNYIFISVDIFLEKLHNEGIKSELDAWLSFLGSDKPEHIIEVIHKYPYFKSMYKDLYNMCLNTERMVQMFSEELKILDRNTVQLMIDELQEQVNSANQTIADKDATIAKLQAELDALKNKYAEH